MSLRSMCLGLRGLRSFRGHRSWPCGVRAGFGVLLGGGCKVYGQREYEGVASFCGKLACLHVAVQTSMVLHMFFGLPSQSVLGGCSGNASYGLWQVGVQGSFFVQRGWDGSVLLGGGRPRSFLCPVCRVWGTLLHAGLKRVCHYFGNLKFGAWEWICGS